MPNKLHDKLKTLARKHGLTGERQDAYVYSTLAKVEKRHSIKVESATAKKRKGKR